MHEIDKQFDFCYGHRVWSQTLEKEFSVDNLCKCRHIHGHQGTIKVGLTAHVLTNGMVTDFKHLNFFKKIIDEDFDHKFIMDKNDPLFANLFPEFDYCQHSVIDKEHYKIIDGEKLKKSGKFTREIIEKLEGLVVVDFVPTSENLAKMFFEIVEEKIKKLGVEVCYVDFWETPKSHCRYTRAK